MLCKCAALSILQRSMPRADSFSLRWLKSRVTLPRLLRLVVVIGSSELLDLLQVDREPCLTAKRPTTSDEVARGRPVSLDGFSFAFRAKNGEWRDSHLGFQVSFESPSLQWRNLLIPRRLNLLNVCVYLHHRRSKFVYFARKLSPTMILGES